MSLKPPKAKKPVPVASFIMKRVYMQGSFYYCGICKRAHRTGEEAQSCLRACWHSLLAKAPWSEINRFGRSEFHCNYCQRAYETADQARLCAEDCSKKLSISALDQTGLVVKSTKRIFVKPEKPQPTFPFKIPGKEHLMPPARPGKKSILQGEPADHTAAAEKPAEHPAAEHPAAEHPAAEHKTDVAATAPPHEGIEDKKSETTGEHTAADKKH